MTQARGDARLDALVVDEHSIRRFDVGQTADNLFAAVSEGLRHNDSDKYRSKFVGNIT